MRFIEKYKDNAIVMKSFAFALAIIEFSDQLREEKRWSLAEQLFRSGTSIGANVMEAQSPESKRDFFHKLKIASKESLETEYWLSLCEMAESLPDPGPLSEDNIELQRILNTILRNNKAGTVER